MQITNIKTIILTILFIIVVTAGSTGCYHDTEEQTSVNNNYPFYTDRVATVRMVMSEDDWAFLQKNARAEQYVRADMWFDGQRIPDIAIRPKGNSSLSTAVGSGSIKFGLKVDLNFFNSARNLNGIKKLNFSNGFSDPTFIREVLAYELFEQMDIPTPRTSLVDFWVNDTHLGLYTMVEQIDKTFLSNHFADSNGNLYKPELSAGSLNWSEKDLGNLVSASPADKKTEINIGGGNLTEIMQALDPKSAGSEAATPPGLQRGMGPTQGRAPPDGMMPPPGMMPPEGMPPPGNMPPPGMPGSQRGNLLQQMGLKTNENKTDHTLLLQFLDILNNEPDETFPEKIKEVLDVDETLRFLAVSALIVHLDNYIGMGHNYYLYENDGRFVIIPWDMNMAFGTFNYGLQRDGLINFYIDEPTGGAVAERPLVKRLLSYQPYLDTYRGYLKELVEGPFVVEKMNSRIDELSTLVRPYVQADERKLYSMEQFEKGLTEGMGQTSTRGFSSLGLKNFIAERRTSVVEQLAGTRKSSSGNGSGNGGSMGFMGNRMRR